MRAGIGLDGIPTIQALRLFRQTALSFIASKLGSYGDHRHCGGRAWSGRHSDDSGAAVIQTDPVIVHREQARLLQGSPASVRAGLGLGGIPTIQALRLFRQTALSFIASKLGSYRDHRHL